MSKRNEVVVGVDGSDASWTALDWAIQYASERRATVAVHTAVVTISGEEMFGGIMDERLDQAEAVMRDAVRRSRMAGVEATGMTSMVPAGRSLVVAGKDALALVVGATGYGALAAALWGSVARHVTRHAEVPVVVVREAADQTATKVVAGVDGTSISQDVIGFGMDAASYRGWDLELLHAGDAPGSWRSWTDVVSADESERRDAVERMIAELGAGWQEKYPDVELETSVVRAGATHALVDASAGAALLVVGAHGSHLVGGHLGSVSQDVVRRARCPVVVLH